MPKKHISPELKQYLSQKKRGRYVLRRHINDAEKFAHKLQIEEAIKEGVPANIVERIVNIENEYLKIEEKLRLTLRFLEDMVRHAELETQLKGTETLYNVKMWLKKHKEKENKI